MVENFGKNMGKFLSLQWACHCGGAGMHPGSRRALVSLGNDCLPMSQPIWVSNPLIGIRMYLPM